VFQMLGSWSLGDYDGPQSQRWGLELLCDGFGLKRDLLYATVFGGDGQVGPEDNWWSNGPTGPCGPDSEIHVWTGDGLRLYPSGRLTGEDYEFLRDTHGLPRELVTELLREA
jgi:alanyl-tRNA synthetase